MSYLRIKSMDKKHYVPGKKRTRMLEAFAKAAADLAIEEAKSPSLDTQGYATAKYRYDRALGQLSYSIGKLENKAYASKRANKRILRELDRYRERDGVVDNGAVPESEHVEAEGTDTN